MPPRRRAQRTSPRETQLSPGQSDQTATPQSNILRVGIQTIEHPQGPPTRPSSLAQTSGHP
jgi:hypothetical protein